MNKPSLRREHLTELTTAEMVGLAGALPNGGSDTCSVIVSNGSCVCFGEPPECNVVVSRGSCACVTGLPSLTVVTDRTVGGT